jgi:hypothetical protein
VTAESGVLPTQQEGGAILCFYGASEGNALEQLIREQARPFAKHASALHFFDLNSTNWRQQVLDVLEMPVWFAMSHFGVGQDFNLSSNGRSVNAWAAHGIPFLRLYGDTPAYFPDRHAHQYPGSINVYSDKAHHGFYTRWFEHKTLSLTMPHTLIDPLEFEQADFDAKLKGKIIFPKNGNSPDELIDYWRSTLPRSITSILLNLAEESVSQDSIGREPRLDERLINDLAARQINPGFEPATLLFMVAQLDDYLRRYKSTLIARALLDLPVIIRGKSWGHLDFSGRRATYDPDSDMGRTQRLIDQAPALVDMSPNTQSSTHDRIRRAAGRWTAFLTDETEFLMAHFNLPHRFTFKLEPDSIQAIVSQYIDRPQDAIEMGIEQSRRLRQIYDEDQYIDAITQVVALASLTIGNRPKGTQNFVNFPPKRFGKPIP